ncbi:MAG TPA: lipid A biosynthesis lauroyl acyltransferase [Leucothrix mucor]|nr:lipid A biosynthesis lauroyl acyltransferase [Leucothrix mucor]
MQADFFHPRYWLTWLGVAFLRLTVLLPWRWQMALGTALGKLLYIALPSRRKVCCINLEIAFPDHTKEQREQLNREHFISLGQGLFESAFGWWAPNKRIKALTHIEGLEHLTDTLKDDRVILLGAHFASLEVGGRILAQHTPLHAVYRPHQNKVIEYLVALKRTNQYGKAIPKTNIRDMIKSIKSGFASWYATDQNFRGKGSILVPFFGIDAPTNPGTSRLAKMTKARVIPVICVRLLKHDSDKYANKHGYLVRFLPPIDNFPSDDSLNDTTRLNHLIEDFIKEFPAQYLWTHKRYKHYRSEQKDFYKDYAQQTRNTACNE